MNNTKFFELISSLSSDEHRKLIKFLPFSMLSNHAVIHKLIDITVKQLQQKRRNDTALEKKNVYQYLFADEEYNEQKINKLLSDSNKAIEGFIVSQAIAADPVYHKMALISFYEEKKLEKYFDAEIRQTELLIQSMKESVRKKMCTIELNEKAFVRETLKNNRQSDFQQVYNNIREYSQLAEIKYRNFALINMNSDLIPQENNNVLYQIHQFINQLLQQHTLVSDFEKCYNLIQSNKEMIQSAELKDCIVILINIVIWQVNDGLMNAQERLFNLHSFLIENDLIIERDNTIIVGHYKNITTIGLYLNKLDYVDNFIETYKKNLPEEIREDVYSYNKAHLLYYKKEYDNVLQLISTTKYKDVFYRLSSRVLLIKTYYALEKTNASYFDILNNSINAFKKYVYTNEELNDYYKTRYKNFIKSVFKLIQLNSDKNQIQKYMDELNNNNDLLEQKWLLQSAENKLNSK